MDQASALFSLGLVLPRISRFLQLILFCQLLLCISRSILILEEINISCYKGLNGIFYYNAFVDNKHCVFKLHGTNSKIVPFIDPRQSSFHNEHTIPLRNSSMLCRKVPITTNTNIVEIRVFS